MILMRMLVISHSYLDSLNAKSLEALGVEITVTAVVPLRGSVLLSTAQCLKPEFDSPVNWVHSRTLRLWGSQLVYLSIPWVCRVHTPDLILVEYNPWSVPFFTAWIAKEIFAKRARMVVSIKKNTYRRPGRWGGLIKDLMATWALRQTDFVLANSEAAASMLIREFEIERGRLDIVPHIGVHTGLFAPKHEQSSRLGVRVGYCGRLDEDKGVMQLLQAVALARTSTGEDITLSVVGTGALLQELLDLAGENAWFQVRPVLEHSLIPGFLDSIDIFVLAAQPMDDHEEHDAQALVEAMASGIACIGTACGVIPEILDGGVGIIVSPGDGDELAGQIARLAQNSEKRKGLGAAGRARAVDLFSIEAVAQRKIDILLRVHGKAESMTRGDTELA